MRHIVFIIAYICFLIMDFRRKEINVWALTIYAIAALVTIAYTRNEISFNALVDMIYSLAFGLAIYLLSYYSGEGIGLADGMYFVINGFLLTLKENILLFLSGIMVAFVIGIFTFYVKKNYQKKDMRMPFMPCFLPAIIGYIICTV